MLGGHSTIVVLIQRKGLAIYFPKPFRVNRADFLPTLVTNLELVDGEAFAKWLAGVWKTLKLKHPVAVVLLADDVVFRKTIGWTGSELQQFWDEVPLSPQAMGRHVQGMAGKQVTATATNKEIYEAVEVSLERIGGKVLAVVPAANFPEAAGRTWGEAECKKILATKNWGEKGSFLVDTVLSTGKKRSPIGRRGVQIGVGVATLAAAVGSTFLIVGQMGNKQSLNPRAEVKATPAASLTVATKSGLIAPSPTPSAIPDRANLNLEVLNGTKTAGLASQAKAYLEEKGYQNVAVGNAANRGYVQTEVAVKSEAKPYLGMLMEDLAGKYEVATPAGVLAAESEFDAVVTLGEK